MLYSKFKIDFKETHIFIPNCNIDGMISLIANRQFKLITNTIYSERWLFWFKYL